MRLPNNFVEHIIDIPEIGIFATVYYMKNMTKNTSILLGDYFNNFINQQIKSGKYSSVSEVVRAALRLFEYEETKKNELINELRKGEKSGFIENFDRDEFFNNLHQKHLSKE